MKKKVAHHFEKLGLTMLCAGLLISGAETARATDVLLYHHDGFNDGQNLNETLLTPSNVSSTFGKLFTVSLSSADAIQPLIKTGVNITTGTSQGVHDVVIAATENNMLYAIDANTGTVLWHVSLLHSFHGGTPSPRGGTHSITDAPAIDPSTNVLYIESVDVENTNNIHILSAINLADGSNYANPVNIAEGTSGSVYVSGPTTASGKQFDSYDQTCRSLTLNPVNHVVYMAYGCPGDVGPYHGWIIGYGATKDGSGNLDLAAVWCAAPNGNESGIWQGGGAIAVDASGNLFVETGNGTFDTTMATPGYVTDGRLTSLTDNSTIPGGLQVPASGDYGDSVVKLTPDSDASQQSDNPNGFGLHVADYFTPINEQSLSNSDGDIGSSSTVLLPNSVGNSTHQQLLVANDKQGVIYLIDRNDMGGYHGDAAGDGKSGTNNVVQQLNAATHGAWCTGAFYAAGSTTSGSIYYATTADGESTGDVAKAFSITNAQINTTPTSTSASSYGTYSYPGSTPEVSANGGSNGILWTLDRGPGLLIAYDASNLGTGLFKSSQGTGNGLTGSIVTFTTPTVANGHVYVGTGNDLNIYGLPAAAYAPVITSSAPPATAYVGIAYNFNYTATGSPNPTFSANPSTLPAGLTLTSAGLLSGTPTATGSYSGVVTASNGVSPAATQNLTINIYSTYNSWVAQEGLTGNQALQTAIVSPDGITNLMKYALGLNPFTTYNPGSAGLPVVKTQNFSGTNYLTLGFTGVAADVTYTVQASSNLTGPWSTIYTYSGPPPPGTVTVQDTQPESASPNRFMHLIVTPLAP